jgi:hypothetical protein
MSAIELSLDCIDVTSTQTRARIDDATVAEYAEAMTGGDVFPAVIIYRDSLQNPATDYLADGFHRFFAAKSLGKQTIVAEVREGTRADAMQFALGANHDHGLRRTNLDKRHCVVLALAEFSGWSSRRIAVMCKVSPGLVDNIRLELPKKATGERLGSDGKTYQPGANAILDVGGEVVSTEATGKPVPIRPLPLGGDSRDVLRAITRAEGFVLEPYPLGQLKEHWQAASMTCRKTFLAWVRKQEVIAATVPVNGAAVGSTEEG